MNTDKTNNHTPPKATTKLCLEKPCKGNPYQPARLYLSGYDIEELAEKCDPVDALFLMFTGEFAKNQEDKQLLANLQVMLSIPSPRHPAARAAMSSGVSKTSEEHLLPISLMALGGTQSGALEVKASIDFIVEHLDEPAEDVADKLAASWRDKHKHIAPGFGQLYGSPDSLSSSFLKKIVPLKPEGRILNWVCRFNAKLKEYDAGVLDVGLAASVFHELSFGGRESVGLYQLLRAPGLLAYAMEQTHNPVSAMPMLEDEQYALTK
jgi:citrate synthase